MLGVLSLHPGGRTHPHAHHPGQSAARRVGRGQGAYQSVVESSSITSWYAVSSARRFLLRLTAIAPQRRSCIRIQSEEVRQRAGSEEDPGWHQEGEALVQEQGREREGGRGERRQRHGTGAGS